MEHDHADGGSLAGAAELALAESMGRLGGLGEGGAARALGQPRQQVPRRAKARDNSRLSPMR